MPQQVFIPSKERFRYEPGLESELFARGEDGGSACGLSNEFVEVEIGWFQRPLTGISAREGKHLLDDACEPTRLLTNHDERLTVLAVFTVPLFKRYF